MICIAFAAPVDHHFGVLLILSRARETPLNGSFYNKGAPHQGIKGIILSAFKLPHIRVYILRPSSFYISRNTLLPLR
jgi:hypothetical protein